MLPGKYNNIQDNSFKYFKKFIENVFKSCFKGFPRRKYGNGEGGMMKWGGKLFLSMNVYMEI